MARVAVLIDGFNLYHALDYSPVKAVKYVNPHRYKKYKWVNLAKLASSYIYDPKDTLVDTYYFTTYAYWNPGKVAKHTNFVTAQKDNGVKVVFGEFKQKDRYCTLCKGRFITHEEKQTDVNIAVMLLMLAVQNACDKLIIVSGDTDLIPAIKSVQSLGKSVGVVIPIGKISEDMKKTADFHYKMKESHLVSSQFSDPYTCANGLVLNCPPGWK